MSDILVELRPLLALAIGAVLWPIGWAAHRVARGWHELRGRRGRHEWACPNCGAVTRARMADHR